MFTSSPKQPFVFVVASAGYGSGQPVSEASGTVSSASLFSSKFLMEGAKYMAFMTLDGMSITASGARLSLASKRPNPIFGRKLGAVRVDVPETMEKETLGRSDLISGLVKSESEHLSSEFALTYSANTGDNWEWKEFTPEETFSSDSSDYDVPIAVNSPPNRYHAGVNADEISSGRGICVNGVSIEVPRK